MYPKISGWQDIASTVSDVMQRTPSDRFFLDSQPALVRSAEQAQYLVQEPYYTIATEEGERVIIKAMIFLAGSARTVKIPQYHVPNEPPDGIMIITNKKLVVHLRSELETDQKEFIAPIEKVQLTVEQADKENIPQQVMHSTHALDNDAYLSITTGSEQITLVPVIFLDSGASPSTVNKNRGFAGLVQMYALCRLPTRLKNGEDPQTELDIYYSHDYSLNRPSASGCLLMVLITIAIPAIIGSMFLSAYLQNGTPVVIGTVIFIVLFLASIMYFKNKMSGKNTVAVKPELLKIT